MKVVELYITDEEESGVSELSLVAEPATHYNWLVFNNTCDGECQVIDHSHQHGEDFSHYLTHSPQIRVEDVSDEEYQKFFRPSSTANQLSNSEDTSEELVRYFYAVDVSMGPKLVKESRQVCRQLIAANNVYRNEDLVKMSAQLSLEDADRKMIPRTKGYPVDLKVWAGGKQCRHIFKKLIIKVPEGQTAAEFASSVPKNANRAFGLKPNSTATQTGPGGISNRKGYLEGRAGFSEEENMSPVGYVEGLIMYPTLKALLFNEPEVKGYSMIVVNETVGFVGGIADGEYFESDVKIEYTGEINTELFYNDYPEGAKEAAAMGIKRNEELGNPCGTLVGKNRAQQISSGENLSEETIIRTYSYLSRARKGFEEARDRQDYEACAYISYLLWGGLPMLSYVERIVNKLQEEMIQEFGCITDLMDKGYGELEARQKCCTTCGGYPKPYDRATDNNEYGHYEEDKEMIEGVIDLLLQIGDMEERKKVAEHAIRTFVDEGTVFDIDEFLQRLGLTGQIEFVENAGGFSVGDYVSWTYAGRGEGDDRARGQIKDLRVQGEVQVPGTDFTLTATEERPVALIETADGSIVGQYTENLRQIQKPEDFNTYIPQTFKDDMKYEITTVVMEPMRYIPRRNFFTQEVYYVVFSEQTVRDMALKFFKDGNHKSFNLEHSDKKLYGGVVYESWIVMDPENDKAKAMGFDVNKGTWMMTAKWEDKKEFEDYVLNGKTMGISLEGGFLSREYSEENFSIVGEMDGEPIFSTEEEALERAKTIGCSGTHKHGDGYMACESHEINERASQSLYNSEYDVFIDEVRQLINKHEN